VRGSVVANESVTVNSLVVSNGSSLKRVTFKPAPGVYTQTTSAGTAVAITGAEESFDITTVSLTTASGALEAFDITHTGVLADDMVQLTQVSYSGGYNVNGALCAHVAAVSTGSITIGIRNWGSGTANGPIKLRFKLFHNSA
jgi:flagellar basal body P-ring protein FlgI